MIFYVLKATLDPTDEILLTDGVLYDVRMKNEIRKFDKLNQNLSGVFHPNGFEIISNSEVRQTAVNRNLEYPQ